MKNQIKKTHNGIIIIFFQENAGDSKYSWKIEGDPQLTQLLLQNSKSKKVKYKAIHFAAEGIFQKIANRKNLKPVEQQVKNENPIVELGMLCQKIFGANIITEVLGKTGPDHAPTVSVRITLPDGREFEAEASNKKYAKQLAAQEALDNF